MTGTHNVFQLQNPPPSLSLHEVKFPLARQAAPPLPLSDGWASGGGGAKRCKTKYPACGFGSAGAINHVKEASVKILVSNVDSTIIRYDLRRIGSPVRMISEIKRCRSKCVQLSSFIKNFYWLVRLLSDGLGLTTARHVTLRHAPPGLDTRTLIDAALPDWTCSAVHKHVRCVGNVNLEASHSSLIWQEKNVSSSFDHGCRFTSFIYLREALFRGLLLI